MLPFIDSPFPTKREYDATLLLPFTDRSAAIRAAERRYMSVRFMLPPGTDAPPPSAPKSAQWNGPLSTPDVKGPRNVKLIHIVRHSQTMANVDDSLKRDPRGIDTRLSEEGHQQCMELQKVLADLRPQIVVSSPMTRTLQTAHIVGSSWLSAGTPVVALEAMREACNFLCDTRRPISAIAAEFPTVDFSACTQEQDETWAYYERMHGSQEAYTELRKTRA